MKLRAQLEALSEARVSTRRGVGMIEIPYMYCTAVEGVVGMRLVWDGRREAWSRGHHKLQSP